MVDSNKSKGFEDLEVWQISQSFISAVYQATGKFPDSEKFGLTNQIRRSAVSIAANIAEGSARNSHKDFARFVLIALGSGAETKSHILTASNLNFLSDSQTKELLDQINQIGRMLKGLHRSLIR